MPKTIDERFAEFHKVHPEIYEGFKKYTFQLIDRGVTHCSADMILHVLRYFSKLDGRPESKYKINNDFSPFYSRLFMEEFKQHEGFFETRIQKSKAA